MALKDKGSKKDSGLRSTRIDLKADRLADFEGELAKIKILEAAYNQIRLTRPDIGMDESLSFGLVFGLNW